MYDGNYRDVALLFIFVATGASYHVHHQPSPDLFFAALSAVCLKPRGRMSTSHLQVLSAHASSLVCTIGTLDTIQRI